MIFGMVSTKASSSYTYKAVESFFKNTDLARGDRFLLIDNDNHISGITGVELLKNPKPWGFGENVNAALKIARESGDVLTFLNNDVIFTRGWFEPLLQPK